MMTHRRSALFCALALGSLVLLSAPALAADSMGCYISSGDNDWLWTSPPVNSPASIDATFEALHKVFGVTRMYWRGTHAEWAVDNFVVRPENFLGHGFWEWERFQLKKNGQTEAAIRAARKLGMDIWGMNPLFDHGAHARCDSAKQGLPSPVEHKLRAEHPEYVPVDRAGLRRQAGPMEFAYPEVRRELIREYVDLLERRGYDGMMFYTYVEHCALRFEDEYGFNQPIVDEFKRRYGQDIRTETFDKNAWYRLRGEYVTQYLREMSAEFHRRGKKLGIAIDPQNSHMPAPWLCVRDVRPTGLIYMDWERWVREGIVDEIMVYCNGALEKALNDVLAVTKGTPCTVSTIHSATWPAQHEHLGRAGVRKVMCGSYKYIEWGYKGEQPAAAIDSDDFLKRLRVLRQVAEKKTELPLARVIAATKDPNLLVRRQAILALVDLKAADAVPTIEAALDDAETGVRCTAASSLCKLHGPQSVDKLFAALRKNANFQLENAASSALANMPASFSTQVVKGCTDKNVTVRQVTTHALGRGLRREEAVPPLIQAMADADPCVRFNAANALARFGHRPEAADCLLAHLDDPHPSVRNRVAIALGQCFRSKSRWVNQRQLRAVQALAKCFREFGDGSKHADAHWSFRPVGNSLLALGPRGRDALQRFMDQRKDKQLADFAWRILHVPQNGWRYALCTEQEALKGYRAHPVLSGWKPVQTPAPPAEPERMPYLQQDFDSFKTYDKGKLGDYLSHEGQWRSFGEVSPEPVIQAKVRRGDKGNAVRLRRGKPGTAHGLEGLRADYRLTTQHAIVEFWLYRQDASASICATWKDSGSGRFDVGIYVASGGKVSVIEGDRKWCKTDTVLPHGSWQRVRFDIDGAKLRYSVSIGTVKLTLVKSEMSLTEGQRYNILTLGPQMPEGGVTYLDDVLVTVPNPAR